jgi:hypothetical protein
MTSTATAPATPDRRSKVFLGLLLLLVGGIFVYPLLGRDRTARAILDLVLFSVLMAMPFVVGHYRRLPYLTLALGIADLALSALSYARESWPLDLLTRIVDLAFWGVLLCTMLASVLRAERVTGIKIYSAIAVYLMIGFAWAGLYALVDLLQPGSFSGPALNMTPGYEPYLQLYDTATSIYLSFVTLTTLGFGDVTPTTVPARTLVWVEALVGQLYLAVLVARLVSLQITHAGSPTSAELAAAAPPVQPGAAPPAPPAEVPAALQAEWRALLLEQRAQIEQHEAEWRALLLRQQQQIEQLEARVQPRAAALDAGGHEPERTDPLAREAP